MLVLILALTAGTIGGSVVADHLHEVKRNAAHATFLYLAMLAVIVTFAIGETRGLLG